MTANPEQLAGPRPGYTLPVFACAGAIAALQHLQGQAAADKVAVNLVNPAQVAEIPVEPAACLPDGSALAMTRSDPGDNLDLTRGTPIWAVVGWASAGQTEAIALVGGEGIGRQQQSGVAAIYSYARRLFQENLAPLLADGQKIQVTIILPAGKALAERTSNAAFGVVEGLSLLGTSGIAQPLSAPGQLAAFRQELQQKAQSYDTLVFCVGENGLDLSLQLGIAADRRLKTANWLGPLLVEAGLQGIQAILLFGYHGKLIKLAGGIFHTHHHVADGRQEILAAHCAAQGLPTEIVQTVLGSATVEAALTYLRQPEAAGANRTNTVYGAIAQKIDQRAAAYIRKQANTQVAVGSILFDRNRQIIIKSDRGAQILAKICYSS
ncbi:cobalt-precorrin-5B (C(1))-methyltransferase CbiD [Sphaerothrix gracilis]|uniref:cobalt-precorrin-5B (C(1))-methyltransferase CbiD n=1 Tax=Sphaerothrix gracilis TaxID=3151835 RepID=UPI0031FD6F6A